MIDQAKVRRSIWHGALTNYLRTGVQLAKTVFLTRLLLFNLGEDLYGFWALLWSVFGYVLVFELGFGKTVQKYAAEAAATGSYGKFIDVVQAVFSSYLVIALIVCIASVAGAWYLPELVKLPAENTSYYQWTFLAFGLGCAAVFPSGILPEVLAGLQKFQYRNWALMLNQLLELFGIWLIFLAGGSLLAIAIFVCCNNLLANLIMLYHIRREIPSFRIGITRLNPTVLREIVNFSGFIYLLALSKLVLTKTDPVVLGAMLGMGAVASYRLGTQIPGMVRMGGGQFQETLGPAAAMYYRSGEMEPLQRLLLKTQRFSIFLAFGALAVIWPLIAPILKVWLKIDDPEVLAIANLMFFNTLVYLAFRDTAREFLLMTGHHRLLAWSALVECVANLALSILLVKLIGATGVAHGTLWPNLVLALFVILPATIRFAKLPTLRYLAGLYLPAALTALPLAALLWYFVQTRSTEFWTFPTLIAVTAAGGALYLVIGLFSCLSAEERKLFREKLHL